MSAADGYLTPPPGAAHTALERRYQRLLRLYPREFRARRESEMLGVLIAAAGEGQARPAPGDVADIVKGALVLRLRGPRGGWATALAVFALLAPLFLVLTDIFQVAFPYWQNKAGAAAAAAIARTWAADPAAHRSAANEFVGATQGAYALGWHLGGVQLFTRSGTGFAFLVVGHVLVAAAVLAGRRRTALATLLVVAVADLAQSHGLALWMLGHFHGTPGVYLSNWIGTPNLGGDGMYSVTMPHTVYLVTITAFLLEAVALTVTDPRAARRQVTWWHAFPLLLLAVAVQAWAFAFDSTQDWFTDPLALAAGFVLAGIALLLALTLGWRAVLLLTAMCYPCGLWVAWTFGAVARQHGYHGNALLGDLATPHLLALYLPPLLTACWGAARTLRTARPRGRGELA